MSLFYRNFNDFSPFFRLANELDRATRATHHHDNTRSFAPRFDVKETQDAYELQGELPGIEQSNIDIEWTDDTTLIISGHTDRIYEEKSPEVTEVANESTTETTNYQKPTFEEEGQSSVENPATKTATKKDVSKDSESSTSRYWITERSTGSFSRSFQFPARVDHDAVKASLKNGILYLVVPKAKAREPRKINIK